MIDTPPGRRVGSRAGEPRRARARMNLEPEGSDAEGGGGRRLGRACGGTRAVARAFALLVTLALLASAHSAQAQTRRAPRPAPTPDAVVTQIESVVSELREVRGEIGALRGEVGALAARLEQIGGVAAETKEVVEPMREEVRGLYVETSNVRSEIARLEQTNVENTASLGKSRYVLTLLLVATAVLQLVVLAVLVRSR